MATEVLRPQDCLIARLRHHPPHPVIFPRRRNYNSTPPLPSSNNNNNNKPARKQQQNSKPDKHHNNRRQRAKSEPSILRRSSSDNLKPSKNGQPQLTMEKVTILRRGESLDSKLNKADQHKQTTNDDLAVFGSGRIGPDPNMIPKQMGMMPGDIYAGSGFAVSPEPSDLPLPSFSKTKKEDSATRDLRRMLGLA